MTDPQPDRQDDGLRPRCSVCNKPLSHGEFCDDLQCPNPVASRDAAEGAEEYETGDEIVFLDSNGEQHKIVYDLTEDQPGLGSGWFIHPDDPFEVAPPKPAPDAMREALQKLVNEVAGVWDAFEFGIRAEISNTNYTCVQERLNEAEAILRDRFPAPVPQADGAREALRQLERLIAYVLHNYSSATTGHDRTKFERDLSSIGKGLRFEIAAFSPSPAVAAEPFAWVVLSDVTGNTRMWTRNGDIAKAFAAKHILECVELYATPPVRGDRESVSDAMLDAHLKATGEWVNPFAAEFDGGCQISDELTQEDADRINSESRDQLRKGYVAALALPVQLGAGEREALRPFFDWADRNRGVVPTESMDELIRLARKACDRYTVLSRQAPHSGDGEGR